MKHSALFVNPPVYDFSAFDLWSKPYGFLFIVDMFIKNQWEVFYFDFMNRHNQYYQGKNKKFGCGQYYSQVVEKPEIYKDVPRKYKRFGLPDEVFVEYLEKIRKIDIVLITCGMTYWYKGVEEVIKTIRKFTDAKIIAGGIYPSFCPEHAKNLGVDIVFQGSNIKDFVSVFNSSTDFHLKYFDRLFPYWDVYQKLSYLVVRTSFGCPFSCYYCGIKKIYPEYVLRNISDVVEEISKNLMKYNVKDIAFYDDALLCKFKDHLEKIIEKIINTWGTLNFHTPNGIHPKFIDRELASFLKHAGFKTLRLSVETIDEKRMKESSFKLNISEFESAIKNLVDAGFTKDNIGAYILAGLPGQDFNQVMETVKFLKQFPCSIKIAEYSPIPGTIDFEISKKLYPFLPLDEPLYQNNSIFPLWTFENKWEKIDYLKNFAKN